MALAMTATWWQLMVPFWRLMSSTTAFLATIPCDVIEGIEPADGVLACFAGTEVVAGLERHCVGGHATNLTALPL